MILIVVVILATCQTFIMMVAVYSYPAVTKRRLADLTLGDLYGGLVTDEMIMLTLIVLGVYLVVLGDKMFGFRHVITERIESEIRRQSEGVNPA